MSQRLETYYRRLLAVYPYEHRLAYEDEMLGVLMAGAAPDRRRPTVAEATDLLRSGLTARVRRGVAGLRDAGWREAAAVAGLLSALVLAVVAGRRAAGGLMNVWFQNDTAVTYALLADVLARAAAWALVVAVLLAGLRRTGAALAAVAVVVELGALASWGDEWRWVGMGWLLVLAALTATLIFLARRARPPSEILGGLGVLAVVGGLALAVPVGALPYRLQSGTGGDLYHAVLALVVLIGIRRVRAGVRHKLVALLAAVVALPVAQQLFADALDVGRVAEVTWPLILAQVLFLAGLPLAAALSVLGVVFLRDKVRVSVAVTRVDGKSD
ncbi:hypothetical protein [Pseudosporangium ferrugineum]|uniref:Uncharacterized protein n=1 Tax=Pseudosporangium ferrugineum TaxID=439699 RepID=A0A2T0SDN0_9ACTN|nr:hypothetical protein [Pseudosporangium ferrugineum]PRY31443.1 hypothetical protein CLV70_103330 [Pseudosporangium ferrugineum]